MDDDEENHKHKTLIQQYWLTMIGVLATTCYILVDIEIEVGYAVHHKQQKTWIGAWKRGGHIPQYVTMLLLGAPDQEFLSS